MSLNTLLIVACCVIVASLLITLRIMALHQRHDRRADLTRERRERDRIERQQFLAEARGDEEPSP